MSDSPVSPLIVGAIAFDAAATGTADAGAPTISEEPPRVCDYRMIDRLSPHVEIIGEVRPDQLQTTPGMTEQQAVDLLRMANADKVTLEVCGTSVTYYTNTHCVLDASDDLIGFIAPRTDEPVIDVWHVGMEYHHALQVEVSDEGTFLREAVAALLGMTRIVSLDAEEGDEVAGYKSVDDYDHERDSTWGAHDATGGDVDPDMTLPDPEEPFEDDLPGLDDLSIDVQVIQTPEEYDRTNGRPTLDETL